MVLPIRELLIALVNLRRRQFEAMNWTNYELYYAMSEKNETSTRGVNVSIMSAANGFIVDAWESGLAVHPTRYVFGSRVQLSSWVASEMPKAKWAES